MRRALRLLFVALMAAAFLGAADAAKAHPLGNFTVNRYAGIEISGRDIYLRYALDLAEIPTYQLGSEVRAPGYAARLARDLELAVNGRQTRLRVVRHELTARPGAGGLDTLRLDVVYRAASSGGTITFVDRAFEGRVGWREVTVMARDGASVVEADVPATSASQALSAYPSDLLASPSDISSARATVDLGTAPGLPPSIGSESSPKPFASPGGGGLEALIERDDLSIGVLLLSLLVAMFWGAVHALTPGHGKAMVAAYLVGTRGTPRHAFALGGTVTVAHTAGVFALGIVTLGLAEVIVPEQLYPWLTFVSGLLVVAVGASVLRSRLRGRHGGGHHHHHHDHEHAGLTSKGILGVGVAAGLLPCPSALVVLLSAIALHRIGLGLALIVAFSLGLAATITAIGLVAVYAQRAFGRISLDGPVIRTLPALSAALILAVGVVITARALPGVL